MSNGLATGGDSVVRQAWSLRQERPRRLARRTGPYLPSGDWLAQRLRHLTTSEPPRQSHPGGGGCGPVPLTSCLGRPCLRDNACLTTESPAVALMWAGRVSQVWPAQCLPRIFGFVCLACAFMVAWSFVSWRSCRSRCSVTLKVHADTTTETMKPSLFCVLLLSTFLLDLLLLTNVSGYLSTKQNSA